MKFTKKTICPISELGQDEYRVQAMSMTMVNFLTCEDDEATNNRCQAEVECATEGDTGDDEGDDEEDEPDDHQSRHCLGPRCRKERADTLSLSHILFVCL